MTRDERFMAAAIEQAKRAASIGEAPIGAVIVRGEEIIAVGSNTRESEKKRAAPCRTHRNRPCLPDFGRLAADWMRAVRDP